MSDVETDAAPELPFYCPACGKRYPAIGVCTNGHPEEQIEPVNEPEAEASPEPEAAPVAPEPEPAPESAPEAVAPSSTIIDAIAGVRAAVDALEKFVTQ